MKIKKSGKVYSLTYGHHYSHKAEKQKLILG